MFDPVKLRSEVNDSIKRAQNAIALDQAAAIVKVVAENGGQGQAEEAVFTMAKSLGMKTVQEPSAF